MKTEEELDKFIDLIKIPSDEEVEAAGRRFDRRIEVMKRRRRIVWSSAAAIVILLSVGGVVRMQNLLQREESLQAINIDDIKVPALVTTKGENMVVALELLDLKKSDMTYIVNMDREEDSRISDDESIVQYQRIVIPSGYTYTVELVDGSKVTLNAGSELCFPDQFVDSMRIVELKGEAYFDVVESTTPFIVKAGESAVKVYGTQFNLFYSDELMRTEAVLIEGSIGMTVGGRETMIKPNQRIYYTWATNEEIKVENVDVTDYIAWLNNSIRYSNMRLDRIIYDISIWYGVKINIPTDIAGDMYSLEFDKSANIGWVIHSLEKLINKEIKMEGGAYQIE